MSLGIKIKDFVGKGINSLPKLKNVQETVDSKLKQNHVLKDFKSSSDDFPKLKDPRNNVAREYLEANRFYNLPPLQDIQGNPNNHRAYSADKNDKYQIDLSKNNEFEYPIAHFATPISPRAFYRESEKLHNISNKDYARETIEVEKGIKESGTRR